MCRFGLLLWWWAGWSSGGLVVAARVDDQVAEERPENARSRTGSPIRATLEA
jgi:hypothetical protein